MTISMSPCEFSNSSLFLTRLTIQVLLHESQLREKKIHKFRRFGADRFSLYMTNAYNGTYFLEKYFSWSFTNQQNNHFRF